MENQKAKNLFFESEGDHTYDTISSKCLIFGIIEEFLTLSYITLDDDVRTGLRNIIEKDWKDNYEQYELDASIKNGTVISETPIEITTDI